jgi:Fe-S-cluster containining protein
VSNDDAANKTCSFDVCSKCKLMCCIDANPPLTPERKEIIAKFLLQQGLPHENVFVNEAYSHPSTDAHGYCTFYNKETGKCRIHPVKPETCRAGPVTFDINPRAGKLEWYLKKVTICKLADCLRVDDYKFKRHFEAAKAEIIHLVSNLDSGSLRTILKIPEPETVKIGESDLPKGIMERLDK